MQFKNNKPWSEQELKVLYTQRQMGVPYRVIGQQLNRSYASCETKYNKDTDWSKYKFIDPNAESQKQSKIQTALKDIDLSITNKIDKFKLFADVVGDKMYKAARQLPLASPPPYTPSNKKQRTSEHMGLLLSDLHIGHEHNLEETGGLSEYNIKIFDERMDNLQRAVTDIKELHSNLYKIPTLHLFLLGDIVDGANTAGSWSSVWIDTPIFDQVMYGYQKISNFIHYMLTLFENVEVYCIYGNHGRIAPSGAEKKYNNFDLFCYKFIEIEHKNQPRVKFHVTKSWWMMPKILNHNFLLMHGDDVKAKNPPISSMLDVERKMAGIVKEIPNYTLCGHFHNCAEITSHNGRILMNGSFVGADVYSLENKMPGTVAEQKTFGIHPKIGITWTYNVNLQYKRE